MVFSVIQCKIKSSVVALVFDFTTKVIVLRVRVCVFVNMKQLYVRCAGFMGLGKSKVYAKNTNDKQQQKTHTETQNGDQHFSDKTNDTISFA